MSSETWHFQKRSSTKHPADNNGPVMSEALVVQQAVIPFQVHQIHRQKTSFAQGKTSMTG